MLASFDITGCMGYWLVQFLTNRNIQVRWKSSFSLQAPSPRGVPQGSVLIPLLFMLFMSDIFETAVGQIYFLLYAYAERVLKRI